MQQPLEEALGREIADIIKMQVAPCRRELDILRRDYAALIVRLAELESRPAPERGEAGQQGPPGTPGTAGAQGESGERGATGAPGRDGKDAEIDWEGVRGVVAALVDDHFEKYPVKDGKDGKNGIDGKDGQNGLDGKDGKDGECGPSGKDGVGIATTLIDRQGNLIITKTDGAIHNAGIVVGRDGKDGLPGAKGEDGAAGRDGFGFDDMEGMDDGLRFGHRFRRGDLIKEFWFNKASLADFDHEIWRAGINYPRGAVVTTGGSLYICKQETNERPGSNGAKHWRLAVKCGRDGKDGERGPIGPAGPKGENAALY